MAKFGSGRRAFGADDDVSITMFILDQLVQKTAPLAQHRASQWGPLLCWRASVQARGFPIA